MTWRIPPEEETIGSMAKAKTPGAPKKGWGKWPKIRPETVAPLRNGMPDLYNFQPTRFISKDESEARGWTHFWTGELCVTGHRAARYTSNPSACVDCVRIEKGMVPVYGKGVPELEEARRRNYTQKSTAPIVGQPSTAEKRFLTAYAELKDFGQAADACGRTEAEFLAILSWNKTFRDAVNLLEESIGIARSQSVTAEFDWTDEKRNAFLITYANTADMKQSLRSVGATNVQFHRELGENAEFQKDFDDANNIAKSVFDHAASASAVKGDARMLGRVAANLFPEKYGENMKVDLTVKGTMTVEQQNAELSTLISGLSRQGILAARTPERIAGPDVIDADYSVDAAAGTEQDDRDSSSEDEDGESDPNSDLVSGSE